MASAYPSATHVNIDTSVVPTDEAPTGKIPVSSNFPFYSEIIFNFGMTPHSTPIMLILKQLSQHLWLY